jgi:hypothetical protein
MIERFRFGWLLDEFPSLGIERLDLQARCNEVDDGRNNHASNAKLTASLKEIAEIWARLGDIENYRGRQVRWTTWNRRERAWNRRDFDM